MFSTNFCNDDFFAEDFHGVVHPRGLFLHQDHFTKRPFAQQLQVVKVTHGLWEHKSKISYDKDATQLLVSELISCFFFVKHTMTDTYTFIFDDSVCVPMEYRNMV